MKEILLTQGKVATISDEDYEEVSKYKWYAVKQKHTFYARRNFTVEGKQKTLLLHRFIMKPPKNLQVDHIDHNGLNNRRENLRVCTRQQNQWNKFYYRRMENVTDKHKKGVYYHKKIRKWRAQIQENGKRKSLGYFHTEQEALKAYEKEARIIHGDFYYKMWWIINNVEVQNED